MKILMCPPIFFEVKYAINVWMDKDSVVDKAKAMREYQTLKEIYESLGVEVMEIEQEDGLPDMVYAANYGFLDGQKFVRANFFHPERRREAILAADYMKKNGYEVFELEDGLYFEGQGDMLKADEKYFCGYGFRTTLGSIDEVRKILAKEVIDLKLVDERWYHLDVCFCPLSPGGVLIVPEAFDQQALEKIYANFDYVIETRDEIDIAGFACNSFQVGNKLITYRMCDETKAKIAQKGIEVIETDMSEFMKGGGSVRCLTMDVVY